MAWLRAGLRIAFEVDPRGFYRASRLVGFQVDNSGTVKVPGSADWTSKNTRLPSGSKYGRAHLSTFLDNDRDDGIFFSWIANDVRFRWVKFVRWCRRVRVDCGSTAM
jgi:hypothetical protein